MPGGAAYWTNYTYDAIAVSVQAPDGASTTSYVYQGNVTTATDPAGIWKATVSDVQGNPVQVTQPDPASTRTKRRKYDRREAFMSAREELHLLLDRIPESDMPTTQEVLAVDPVELAILTAPEDDEPESEEERAAVEAAVADPAPDIPWEQIRVH